LNGKAETRVPLHVGHALGEHALGTWSQRKRALVLLVLARLRMLPLGPPVEAIQGDELVEPPGA
jgi:hypothetical protein